MHRKRPIITRLRKNNRASLEGLPLYLLVMVVVAAVSLVAILSFIVSPTASFGKLSVEPFLAAGKRSEIIIVDLHIVSGGWSGYYYRGCDWTIDSRFYPKSSGYSEKINISITSSDGKWMADVAVAVRGPNITFIGRTDASGRLEIPLDGLWVNSSAPVATKLTITARAKGLIGEDVRTKIIYIIAK